MGQWIIDGGDIFVTRAILVAFIHIIWRPTRRDIILSLPDQSIILVALAQQLLLALKDFLALSTRLQHLLAELHLQLLALALALEGPRTLWNAIEVLGGHALAY